jgi:autotransporter passenger strand-loop-strand repeat protein
LSYEDTIHSGGQLYVSSGGVDSASLISSGGKETVFKGGVAYYDTVASGGAQYDHGVTSHTTISKGGTEDVFSGAAADTSQIYGSEVVSSGGSVYADTVHSGGALTVSSGGSVFDGLTISSGYAGISGAVASGQEIRFAGTGDLAFYDLAAFHATIGGYSTGDEFDLGGFAFGAGETRSFAEAASHTSGTLHVVDGGKTATLSLLGSYVTGDFALSNDLHGGTLVKFV